MYPLWVHNMSGGKVVWIKEHLAGTPVAPEWSAGAWFFALKHWSRVDRHVSLMSQTQQTDTRSKDQGCAPSCSLYGLLYLFLATSILKGSWGMWLCIHKIQFCHWVKWLKASLWYLWGCQSCQSQPSNQPNQSSNIPFVTAMQFYNLVCEMPMAFIMSIRMSTHLGSTLGANHNCSHSLASATWLTSSEQVDRVPLRSSYPQPAHFATTCLCTWESELVVLAYAVDPSLGLLSFEKSKKRKLLPQLTWYLTTRGMPATSLLRNTAFC